MEEGRQIAPPRTSKATPLARVGNTGRKEPPGLLVADANGGDSREFNVSYGEGGRFSIRIPSRVENVEVTRLPA